MGVSINCIFNDQGAWCTNKNIKRSVFGIGARCCIEYPPFNGRKCKFKQEHKRSNKPLLHPIGDPFIKNL